MSRSENPPSLRAMCQQSEVPPTPHCRRLSLPCLEGLLPACPVCAGRKRSWKHNLLSLPPAPSSINQQVQDLFSNTLFPHILETVFISFWTEPLGPYRLKRERCKESILETSATSKDHFSGPTIKVAIKKQVSVEKEPGASSSFSWSSALTDQISLALPDEMITVVFNHGCTLDSPGECLKKLSIPGQAGTRPQRVCKSSPRSLCDWMRRTVPSLSPGWSPGMWLVTTGLRLTPCLPLPYQRISHS